MADKLPPVTKITKKVTKSKPSAALGFIFITIFIDVLGLGIIIPVMPKLLQMLGHVDVSTASKYNGWLTLIYATMQLVFASIMGNLSDRYGRRPVLLISLFGFSIDYMFMAFAPSIAWLFLGRFIAGITGASTSTATAYIADISTGHKRDANFGLVGAASGFGVIIGIALGAYLGEINIKFPFMAAAGFAFFNGLYGLFVLPESLKPEHRRKFEWKRANPLGALIRVFTKHTGLGGLIGCITLVYIAQKAVEYLLSFFLFEKFNWALSSVGTLGIFIGVVLVAIQGGLIRYTIPKFGQEKNIVFGLIFYALGLTLIAFATKGWMMYLFMIPYCLGGISGPALQGLATKKVAKNEQGELQGALTIINSISVIIGPFIFSYIFYNFTNKTHGTYFPGAPYLLAAFLMLISVFLAIKSFRNHVGKVRSVKSANPS
ncbi:TCR/Tet family MFS transporter [Mucilaginibacter sp. UR6-11]|uniref:TCR/Tet family MFS transporter n=1 Tax=Mucilaginibacter sp. UR6-11 TaxID=1435644 RepID=UPI001E5301EB|nr:TCR/Tet family MFS transporter [Mucilaginibacter sp. UR6-11]MCC8425962.1 TCR/Tet family MFS transporter [Mucilaginibacter sp. UR6-11]